MKTFMKSLAIACLAITGSFITTSCDEEDKPAPPIIEEPEVAVTDFQPNIVVMNFTGQLCAACGYKQKNIIPVIKADANLSKHILFASIHGNERYSELLFNEQAKEYLIAKKVNSFPHILFNNTGEVKRLLDDEISEAMKARRAIKTEVKAKYNEADKSIEVTVKAKKIKDGGEIKAKKFRVLIWVLENGIVGNQEFIGKEHVHNSIFRGYVGNNIWGQPYELIKEYKYKGSMPKTVSKPSNCEVLAIILDDDTKEFIDAERALLK